MYWKQTKKKKDLTRQHKRHIHWYLHRVLYFIASLGEQILIHTRQIVPLYFYDDTVANLSSYSQNARLDTQKRGTGVGGASGSWELKQMGVNWCDRNILLRVHTFWKRTGFYRRVCGQNCNALWNRLGEFLGRHGDCIASLLVWTWRTEAQGKC
jgi:hypothetical protein